MQKLTKTYKVVRVDGKEVDIEFASLFHLEQEYPQELYKKKVYNYTDEELSFHVYTIQVPKVNVKNGTAIVQAATRMLQEKAGTLPKHIKEQIDIRRELCEPCLGNGKCFVCGCPTPNLFYANKACPINKYPELMNKKEWALSQSNLISEETLSFKQNLSQLKTQLTRLSEESSTTSLTKTTTHN